MIKNALKKKTSSVLTEHLYFLPYRLTTDSTTTHPIECRQLLLENCCQSAQIIWPTDFMVLIFNQLKTVAWFQFKLILFHQHVCINTRYFFFNFLYPFYRMIRQKKKSKKHIITINYWPATGVSNNKKTQVKAFGFSPPVIRRHTMTAVWPNFDWLARPHCHRNCSISHALLILQVNDCKPFAGTFIKCCISLWVQTTEAKSGNQKEKKN